MQADIDRLVSELEQSGRDVQRAYQGRTDVELSRHQGTDGWCAKQILGHLVEAEGDVFGALIPGMLGRTAPANWDTPPSMVRADCDDDAMAMLSRFAVLRAIGVMTARSLRVEDLEITSDRNWHKGPTETIGDLLRHWPEHTREHLSQVRAVLESS